MKIVKFISAVAGVLVTLTGAKMIAEGVINNLSRKEENKENKENKVQLKKRKKKHTKRNDAIRFIFIITALVSKIVPACVHTENTSKVIIYFVKTSKTVGIIYDGFFSCAMLLTNVRCLTNTIEYIKSLFVREAVA